VFRFSTYVPLGGVLYPWRCGRRAVRACPLRARFTRTRQQGVTEPCHLESLSSSDAITSCEGVVGINTEASCAHFVDSP
jgi:hypothetical protein